MSTAWQRLRRGYSKADWVAHLIVATWVLAALNFHTLIVAMIEESRSQVADGFVVISCRFGPPPAFYPRLLTLAALSLAVLAAFGRTKSCRVITNTSLASALGLYAFWWCASYETFLRFESAGIFVFANEGLRQSVYLYAGSPDDFTVALSILVCLVLALERLFVRH